MFDENQGVVLVKICAPWFEAVRVCSSLCSVLDVIDEDTFDLIIELAADVPVFSG